MVEHLAWLYYLNPSKKNCSIFSQTKNIFTGLFAVEVTGKLVCNSNNSRNLKFLNRVRMSFPHTDLYPNSITSTGMTRSYSAASNSKVRCENKPALGSLWRKC